MCYASHQENVEIMTKRLIPLENLDAETNLSDVQQVGHASM